MPSLGFGEILVILLVALLVFGPRKLPGIGKSVGQAMREFRQSAREVRGEIRRGLEEAADEPDESAPNGEPQGTNHPGKEDESGR